MREEIFSEVCVSTKMCQLLWHPLLSSPAWISLLFFVYYYKLFRLVPLLLMLFTTTDSISFCKKHWLMQKVWASSSFPHLPLNSFLNLLDAPWLAVVFGVITPLPGRCHKTRIFLANQGAFSVLRLGDSKGRLQARSSAYVMVALLWRSWSSTRLWPFANSGVYLFDELSFFLFIWPATKLALRKHCS